MLMEPVYRHILVEVKNDVFCVRLNKRSLTETEVLEMADEVVRLIEERNCCKMVLSLGPEDPYFLYSVFLAKLIMVRRRLLEAGGKFKIADASSHVRSVFEAAQMHQYFDF